MNWADALKDIYYKINQNDCTKIWSPFHGGINYKDSCENPDSFSLFSVLISSVSLEGKLHSCLCWFLLNIDKNKLLVKCLDILRSKDFLLFSSES